MEATIRDCAICGNHTSDFEHYALERAQLSQANRKLREVLQSIEDVAHKALNGGCKMAGRSERVGDVKNELRIIRERARAALS